MVKFFAGVAVGLLLTFVWRSSIVQAWLAAFGDMLRPKKSP